MSEQVVKNVAVLKRIKVDEFMATMGFISAATNYNCIHPCQQVCVPKSRRSRLMAAMAKVFG